jgi:hypothetical protein
MRHAVSQKPTGRHFCLQTGIQLAGATMTYDHWKTTEHDNGFDHDEPEFCVIHGYEHMKQDFGNPIAYCAECDRERQASAETEGGK